MSKTTFLLGAGASVRAGVPVMKNFLDEAYDLWQQKKLSEEDAKHFKNVFNGIASLQKIHSKSKLDINNLESVFATFEMAKLLQKMPDYEKNQIENLIRSLKRLIVVTIEKKLHLPFQNQYAQPPEPYDDFAGLVEDLQQSAIPNQEISILTFNYDIAIDFTLYKKGIGPDYCLSTHSSGNNSVRLLKLHGSLNWGTSKDNNQITPWDLRDYFSYYKWRGLSSANYVTCSIGTHLKEYNTHMKHPPLDGEPVIVPPTWNKSNHHNELSEIWSKAANDLEKTENLFIIGFSLPQTDVFFRHLYALGTTGDIPFKRFWVFDPDPFGEVENRYRELLGPGAETRFKFFNKTFKESIPIIKQQFSYER